MKLTLALLSVLPLAACGTFGKAPYNPYTVTTTSIVRTTPPLPRTYDAIVVARHPTTDQVDVSWPHGSVHYAPALYDSYSDGN
jgi:hypothetical protein